MSGMLNIANWCCHRTWCSLDYCLVHAYDFSYCFWQVGWKRSWGAQSPQAIKRGSSLIFAFNSTPLSWFFLVSSDIAFPLSTLGPKCWTRVASLCRMTELVDVGGRLQTQKFFASLTLNHAWCCFISVSCASSLSRDKCWVTVPWVVDGVVQISWAEWASTWLSSLDALAFLY